MTRRAPALGVLLCACVAQACARGQPSPPSAPVLAPPAPPARPPSPPLEAEAITLTPYRGKLRTLPVKVGDRELPFILDTAGGITFLSPDTVAAAGCSRHGTIIAFRMHGDRLEVPRCVGGTLAVGSHRVAQDFAIFDVARLLPPDWPRVAGVLSLLSLESVPFTLDLGANALRLESEESLAAATESMTPVVYRESRPAGGAGLDVFVAVEAGRAPLWFELDSGNTGPVLVSEQAAALLRLETSRRHDRSMEAVATVTITLPGFAPLRVPARRDDLIYDGVLGAEVMEKLVFAFDLSRGRIWARRAGSPRR